MQDSELEIRSDLKDISNTIEHLYELAHLFGKYNLEWGNLWHATDRAGESLDHIHSTGDIEFTNAIEEVYRRGRDTAVSLTMDLTIINNVGHCPRLQIYIDTLRQFQSWITEDEVVLDNCENIIERKKYFGREYLIDYSAIRSMIKLHRKQLNIIRSLDADIIAIQNSVRYKMEDVKDPEAPQAAGGKVFIIHGHAEAKWRELEKMLKNDFNVEPIVLQEQPDGGMPTVIEKFEAYVKECAYAIAVFTPDDEVEKDNVKYLQPRPNVIFELGWFCGFRSRNKAMMLLQKGTTVFSDIQGVLQKRFITQVKEVYRDIEKELIKAGIIEPKRYPGSRK